MTVADPVTNKLFRCAHCTFTTPKWRTRPNGKRVSGWKRLQDHLAEEHEIYTDLIGDE